MSATNSSTIRLKWSAMSRDDHESPDCELKTYKIYIYIYMCEHTAFSPHAVLCERVDVTLKMLASKGIVPIRRNHREPRHLAQPIFMRHRAHHRMAMRQMTRFSMVSSIQDDSLGSKHLQSDI